jgi:hypothetical protein
MNGSLLIAIPLVALTLVAILLLLPTAIILLCPQQRKPREESLKRAEEKGIALLRSWLTPEQYVQFALRGEFEVIGCDTGTRYCITRSPMMNVKQLNNVGGCVARWCFMPQGGLVSGDVMLAQKIALETMERRALAVANSARQFCSLRAE